jgi:hypothetical protein
MVGKQSLPTLRSFIEICRVGKLRLPTTRHAAPAINLCTRSAVVFARYLRIKRAR